LQITHPHVSHTVNAAVDNLESAATAMAGDTNSDAQSALTSAISTLDAALLDTSGLFGPQGPISEAPAFTPNLTSPQSSTSISHSTARP
jgi:hypothetical protein